MFLRVSTETDYRRHQNISDIHVLGCASSAKCVLPDFDIICSLLLYRHSCNVECVFRIVIMEIYQLDAV